MLLLTTPVAAQQVADTAFQPPIADPAFAAGRGPVVALDEAHHNFHTADGRYAPFARLLRRDGYRVIPSQAPFTGSTLAPLRLLVIANAIAAANQNHWIRPILPAFTATEVEAVRRWVEQGGSLLLIADHMPFAGASEGLARAVGFAMTDGFTLDSAGEDIPVFSRSAGTLRDHSITRGTAPDRRVDSVRSFTGQAFRFPVDAVPLMVLPEGMVNWLPDTAWQFSDHTPRTPAGGLAQGAVRTLGRGRVAVFGEAAMFSAQRAGPSGTPAGMNAPGATQNVALLRNLIAWLTEPR